MRRSAERPGRLAVAAECRRRLTPGSDRCSEHAAGPLSLSRARRQVVAGASEPRRRLDALATSNRHVSAQGQRRDGRRLGHAGRAQQARSGVLGGPNRRTRSRPVRVAAVWTCFGFALCLTLGVVLGRFDASKKGGLRQRLSSLAPSRVAAGMAFVVLSSVLRLPCRRPGSLPRSATAPQIALFSLVRSLWPCGSSHACSCAVSPILRREMKTKTYMECADLVNAI